MSLSTMRLLSRIALLAASLAITATAVTAQTLEHDHDHDQAGHSVLCGSEWADQVDYEQVTMNTMVNNPALYSQMVNGKREAQAFSAGAEIIQPFYLVNRVSGEWETVRAALRYEGENVLLWVDVRDTGHVRASTIDAFAEGLERTTKAGSRDPNKGIVEVVQDIFGAAPENEFDPTYVASFLFTDIQDQISGGDVLGYFSSWDKGNGVGSNEQNILYIDSREGLGSQSAGQIDNVLGTLAHEFQHLIHYGRFGQGDRASDRLYNEGLSEVATIRCGYPARNNFAYLNSPNQPLFDFPSGNDGGPILRAYERGETFIHYLSEQFGDDFLNTVVATKAEAGQRVKLAMEARGLGSNWQSVMRGFNIANYLHTAPGVDNRYRYQLGLGGVARSERQTLPKTGEPLKLDTVNLAAFGAYFFQYLSPSEFKIRAHSLNNREFGIDAIVQKKNGTLEVREMNPDEEYTFGNDVTWVVFVATSLVGESQNVEWSVEAFVSGVEDEESVSGPLALVSTVPNPTVESTRLTFRNERASVVRLDVFNVGGKLVQTIVDGERMEAGEHSVTFDGTGLPAGVYVARFSDDAGVNVSKRIVLMK